MSQRQLKRETIGSAKLPAPCARFCPFSWCPSRRWRRTTSPTPSASAPRVWAGGLNSPKHLESLDARVRGRRHAVDPDSGLSSVAPVHVDLLDDLVALLER